jgi:hypothetical protein
MGHAYPWIDQHYVHYIDTTMTYYAKTTSLGRAKKYHSDKECFCLQRADNYRKVTEVEINQWGLTECKHCQGFDHRNCGESMAHKLMKMDAEEVL